MPQSLGIENAKKTAPKAQKPSIRAGRPKTVVGAAEEANQLAADKEALSLREACRVVSARYNLKEGSVWRTMTRSRQNDRGEQQCHGLNRLSQQQEETVVGWILAFDRSSLPLNGRQIRDAIEHVFGVAVSKTWLTTFKRRHRQHLRTRTPKPITRARISSTTPAEVDQWISGLEAFMELHYFPARARFNIDETRILPASRQKKIVGAPSTKAVNKYNNRAGRTSCTGTWVPLISAVGDLFMSTYVVKAKGESEFHEVIPADKRGQRCNRHFYAVSKTGFLNRGLFQTILTNFEAAWHEENPGLDCIVFLDNCSIHRSDFEQIDANFVLQMAAKGVWLYFFPPNVTAYLQPLDDVAFGSFKQKLGRQFEEYLLFCWSSSELRWSVEPPACSRGRG